MFDLLLSDYNYYVHVSTWYNCGMGGKVVIFCTTVVVYCSDVGTYARMYAANAVLK